MNFRDVGGEGSRDNISMHHHTMDVIALIQTQLLKYFAPSEEHKWRANVTTGRRVEGLTGS
ncbi:hypothetical protein Pyn_25024 [Prunus yedoensis var. nudiflora]|uniref:Uncharacterized protein n=1 Tax=Prunus yedoensis var. nudiflora TaxID=2094558 RepID=A0A314YVN1_PRUYE|nr:hypothetical protein Pyn_25024 [Prunus yedoensis var. nudiflora]